MSVQTNQSWLWKGHKGLCMWPQTNKKSPRSELLKLYNFVSHTSIKLKILIKWGDEGERTSFPLCYIPVIYEVPKHVYAYRVNTDSKSHPSDSWQTLLGWLGLPGQSHPAVLGTGETMWHGASNLGSAHARQAWKMSLELFPWPWAPLLRNLASDHERREVEEEFTGNKGEKQYKGRI